MKPEPMYLLKMPGAAHQLLWWLIMRMDSRGEVLGGWRTQAEQTLGVDRSWIRECVGVLVKHGLIETHPRARWVKVNVNRIVG